MTNYITKTIKNGVEANIPVTSVNWQYGDVTINPLPSGWTVGQVLTKTATWADWENPSWWIQNDTTGTTSTVTKIRAWSEAEFNALSSKDATTIYHVF